MTVPPMNTDRFWEIVGKVRGWEKNPDHHLTALKDELMKLSLDDIAGFQSAFAERMRDSYTWGLWAAAYVIHGGASDDGFQYFRTWLIFKGRDAFETAQRDPDSLADRDLVPGPEGLWEFEELAYAANEVWKAKGGKGDVRDMAAPVDFLGEPKGTRWNDGELSETLPKLFKRFGANPLPH